MSEFEIQKEQFKEAMLKYKFAHHISVDVQKQALKSKKTVYKRVLKTLGKLTIITTISTAIYFLIKKMGIKMFLTKLTASLVVTSSAAVGVAYSVKYINETMSIKPASIILSSSRLVLDSPKDNKILKIQIKYTDDSIKKLRELPIFKFEKKIAKIERNNEGHYTITGISDGKTSLTISWKKLTTTCDVHVKKLKKEKKVFKKKEFKHTEKIYMKDGTVFTGILIEKGKKVILVTPEGRLTLDKSDIKSIEYLTPKK